MGRGANDDLYPGAKFFSRLNDETLVNRIGASMRKVEFICLDIGDRNKSEWKYSESTAGSKWVNITSEQAVMRDRRIVLPSHTGWTSTSHPELMNPFPKRL